MLNGNLVVNLKTPPTIALLNGRGQFTFLKTKSSHTSSIAVVYPPKFEFLRNYKFLGNYDVNYFTHVKTSGQVS